MKPWGLAKVWASATETAFATAILRQTQSKSGLALELGNASELQLRLQMVLA